jgi:multidrug resistance efflux pump
MGARPGPGSPGGRGLEPAGGAGGRSLTATFARSIRSLHADSHRGALAAAAVVLVLLASWVAWMFLGAVAVYEISAGAQLEVELASHDVAAPHGGRIVASALVIGREIGAGDVLVELDDEPLRLELNEVRARLAAATEQVEAVRVEQQSQERALEELRRTAPIALDEARARHRETESASRFAAEQAERTEQLFRAGDATDLERRRTQAEAEQRAAAEEAMRIAVDRLHAEQRVAEADRLSRVAELARELARLEGQRGSDAAVAARLEHDVASRRIAAPVSGRIAEAAKLHRGSVVAPGDWIATIVPASETIRVSAEFPAATALGRLAPGQRARVRLAGFPSTQYGAIAATVERVAGEARGGMVRAELVIQDDGEPLRVPLQHGLAGSVEVEVERVSPAVLILRASGSRR